MTTLQVHLRSRYSNEFKARLSAALSTVVAGVTRSDRDDVSIRFDEEKTDANGQDAQLSGPVDPAMLVMDYLIAMQQRDLEKAQHCLDDGFVMSFPGSPELSSIAQLVEWSKTRYRFVTKTIAAVNVAYEPNMTVVIVHGTLSGEWPDGSSFDSVRFLDRFEVSEDKLKRQDVWNDLANVTL